MKKVILASLLACAAIASGLPAAYGQAPAVVPGGAAAAPCALPDPEYKVYNDATSQKDPKAMAGAIEAYLTAFPTSACPDTRLPLFVTLMTAYYNSGDATKTLDAADRVLKMDPSYISALVFETVLRKAAADSLTDPAAKQAALDAAAGYAQKGLAAPKPSDMPDANYKAVQGIGTPIFYSAIGNDDMGKKDTAGAIDNIKKELASVPIAQTEVFGPDQPELLDTYQLAVAYWQSTPPDWLDCAFYAARFQNFASEPYKSQFGDKTGRYCYKQFHGDYGGYETFLAAAKNGLTPPDGLFAGVKPAPTMADIIAAALASTPDLTALNPDDRESIFEYGTPDQIGKVWDSIKGKSYQFPNELVIASTPTQVQVAISSGAVASKTADYTFNLTPPEDIPEPKATATPAQKAAYQGKAKAAKKTADAIAAATAAGQSVTLEGTYDSYTAKPLMFVMSDASVILPKAAAKPVAPTAHRTTMAPH
jgi:hypothetical protein